MGLFDAFRPDADKFTREVDSAFYEAISAALQLIKQFAVRILKGVLNFFKDIVKRFKDMVLKATQYPFITTKNMVESFIKKAKIPYSSDAIFSAVYDENTDEVVMGEYVGADSLDADTKNVLKNHKLRVLN